MKTALPIAWFILIALVVLSIVARVLLAGSGGDPQIAIFVLPGALLGIVGMIGIALAYLLAYKSTTNTAVGVIGFVHLFFAASASVLSFVGGRIQDNMMTGGDFTDAEQLGLYLGTSSLLSGTGGLLFIAAMTVAILSGPPTNTADNTFG